jgi:peptidoglycan lytic transglycosylase G
MVKKFVSTIVILVALGATAAYYFFFRLPGPYLESPRMVEVRRGESLRSIGGSLRRADVVRSSLAFDLCARLMAAANRLQPGDYRFAGGETLSQVLGHLVRGESVVITVSVPEGSSVRQIAHRLEMARLVCESKFVEVARTSPLLKDLGLAPLGVEGYLFPATYRFEPSATAQEILAAMLERFFAEMSPQVEERAFQMGLSTRELTALASMVEKEAKVPAERPLIAGVFYNRLRLHMPLQSDPTAQYSFDGITGHAAQAVHTPSAFNTYDFAGLPPGPIANPGGDSIHAALYPTPTDYLYFVARKDGSHIFSRTLKEHDQAIANLRKVNFHPQTSDSSAQAALPARRNARK